jgi:hypothetical protein
MFNKIFLIFKIKTPFSSSESERESGFFPFFEIYAKLPLIGSGGARCRSCAQGFIWMHGGILLDSRYKSRQLFLYKSNTKDRML